MSEKNIKDFTTHELETELLERHKRDQAGNINDLRDVVALRNQLLGTIKEPKETSDKDYIIVAKKNWNTLIRDYQNTTANWKKDWITEIQNVRKEENN